VIEEAVYSRLNKYASVSALVSGRIYPLVLEQNTSYPAITYTKVASVHIHDLDGSAGLANPTFQVDSWAYTYPEARNLSDAVRRALQGYSGSPYTGTVVSGIYLTGERHFYDSEVKIYRVSADYEVWHSEVIP